MHQLIPQTGGAYAMLLVTGIIVSAVYWFRRSKNDPALLVVYIGALGGAFLGAKLAYLFAEIWFDWDRPDFWARVVTGKSVLGGLLGGYAGVEIMKKLVGHDKSTGDAFAVILPVGLMLGRVGCWLHGCCLGREVDAHFAMGLKDGDGIARWPAVQVEMAFLVVMLVLMLVWKARAHLCDRLFFIFLAAYGAFRFLHEWPRDTPKWGGVISGYQIIALAMAVLGVAMLIRRSREISSPDDRCTNSSTQPSACRQDP